MQGAKILMCETFLELFARMQEFPFVVEVNLICGKRRSLLSQIGSSNNRITLRHKFLISIDQIAYLKSNVIVHREDSAPVSLLQKITILPLVVIKHLHIQETRRTHKRKTRYMQLCISQRRHNSWSQCMDNTSGTITKVTYH